MTRRTLPALLIPGLLLLCATDAAAAKPLQCKSAVARKAAANHFAKHLKKKKLPYKRQASWPKAKNIFDLNDRDASSVTTAFSKHSSVLILHTNKRLNLFLQSFVSLSSVHTCTYEFPSADRAPQFKEIKVLKAHRPQVVNDKNYGGFNIKRRADKIVATMLFIVPSGEDTLLIDAKAKKR